MIISAKTMAKAIEKRAAKFDEGLRWLRVWGMATEAEAKRIQKRIDKYRKEMK